jgi:Tfp pilus assembly protein PilO
MSSRDRMVILGVLAIAILGIGWVKFVSPERKKVSAANAQIEAARTQLQSAQAELSSAQQAQARFADAYASVVALGKAVPSSTQTPALLYELDQATGRHKVEFSTFSPGGGSSAGSAAKSAPSTGFRAVPFSFTFTGNFTRLYDLLNTLQGFDVQMPTGNIEVTGRLMTIQALSLTPAASASTGGGGSGEQLTGTISATAYVLPATASLPSVPAPAASSAGAPAPAAASSSGSASATAAPATIRAVP